MGISNSDRYIIAKLLGPEILGGYYFAVQISNVCKMLIRAINSSMLTYYSKSAVGDITPKKNTV